MTETRKWTLGAALLAVVIMVAGWFLLIAPQRAEVADLELQTTSQVDTNSRLETELALLKEQNKDLPEKQAELAELRTAIPEAPDLPSYIREMQDIGRQSGVSFTSLTPAAPVDLGGAGAEGALTPGQLSAVNIDMIIVGSYFEITKFMNELETSPRYTLVSGDTIVEDDAEGEQSSGGSPVLNATVNARIYLVPTVPEVTDTTAAGTDSTTSSPAPAP
ncbi:MAG: type 4a pilus biogenesis protein PilO [Actinomycetes bacterium]